MAAKDLGDGENAAPILPPRFFAAMLFVPAAQRL
jgi:hypothetical protein